MRLPLATDISSRDGTLTKDSLMKNAFAEKVGEEFDVFKRPGLSQAYDLGVNQGQGMVSWKGTFFAVIGNVLTQGPSASPVPDGATYTKTTDLATGLTSAQINAQSITSAYNSANDTVYFVDLSAARRYIHATSSAVSSGSIVYSGADAQYGSCIWFSSKVYHLGGIVSGVFSKKVISSSDGINFTAGADAAWTGRINAGVGVSSDGLSMYIAGGKSDASTALADVWETQDGTNWTQVTMPGGYLARSNPVVYSRGGYLYIGGGAYSSTQSRTDLWKGSKSGAVWTWTQVSASAFGDTAGKGWDFGGYNIGGSVNGSTLVNLHDLGVYRGNQSDIFSLATASPAFEDATYGVNGVKVVGNDLYFIRANRVTDSNNVHIEFWKSSNNAPGGYTYTLSGASSLPISFTQTSGAASTEYLFVKTTGKAWVLTFGSPGTLTQVTDVDYPTITVPGSAYLDGYFFVMTTAGEIYNSALEDPLSWGALDFISAEIEPDDAVALGKHMNYVVAFKSTTTELFYDAANASGSPLARLSNAAIQVGCANGYSIASLDAGLFFLSKFRSNQKSVHYFPKDGLQPVEIANPSIKRILTAADTSTVHCFAAQLNGHSFYVVTLPTEGLTLAYDLTAQTWAQWTFLTAAAADSVSSLTQSGGVATATATAHGFADGDPVTIAGATPSGYNGDVNIKYVDANTFTYPVSSALSTPATGTITATGWTEGYFPFGFYINALSKDYVQHETSGKIYEISADYGDDAGAPIDLKVRTPPLNQGSIERKTMSRLAVVGDNTTGTLLVRYSDDDYVTFSKYRPIDLSTTNKQVRRLGDYRERALDFRYTGDNKIRIRSVDIE